MIRYHDKVDLVCNRQFHQSIIQLSNSIIRLLDSLACLFAIGTIGVFAMDGGLFYGGGWHFLGVEALGSLVTCVWSFGLGMLTFVILKKVHGIRVEARVEEEGLDIYEHGETAYNI